MSEIKGREYDADLREQLNIVMAAKQENLFSSLLEQKEEALFSGLILNTDTHTIKFGTPQENIGLDDLSVVRKPDSYDDADNLIGDAWKQFGLDGADSADDDDSVLDYGKLDTFLQGKHLKECFDENLLRNAVSACNSTWPRATNCGEMYYQQTVYAAFSGLLIAAAPNLECYSADEDVSSSLYSKMTKGDSEEEVDCDVTIQPDAAVC
eukprot:scaffold49961_cov44-Attheya_sp.AAC.1